MRAVRISSRVGAAFLCVGLLAGSAPAENLPPSSREIRTSGSAAPSSPVRKTGGSESGVRKASAHSRSVTNVLSLKAELRHELLPGFSPVTRVIASAGTNKYTFLVPRGFRVDASDSKKITLIYSNEAAFVTMRLLRPLPPLAEGAKKQPLRDRYREMLLTEQPRGKILSEFSRGVDGNAGFAFDVQSSVAGAALESNRVILVPSHAGVLEFRLKTIPVRFHALTYKFNNFLLSFRSSRNGELEIVPLSNKF